MGFNFPAAPAIDEVWTDAVSGAIYTFDGTMWKVGNVPSVPPGDAWVLKVGDIMTGALQLPVADPVAPVHAAHKGYVDRLVAAESLFQGAWQVAANTPDLTPAVALPLHSYSWIAQTVDPAVPETAPAALPGIGGQVIGATDTVIWNENLLLYELIRGPAGISQMTIADAPPATGFHGQCWWDSDSGKQYVYYDDGTSQQWVQMSGGGGGGSGVGVIPDDAPTDTQIYGRAAATVGGAVDWTPVPVAGMVIISDTAPVASAVGAQWWNSSNGDLSIWYDDGTSTQWVQTNVEEAPVDGTPYVRQDAGWVTTTATGLADAPADGSEYLRKDNAWVNPSAAAGAYVPLDGSLDMTGGLGFGSAIVASPEDISRHIELYGGANGLGISTTTGGQFNFICKHADHAFNFRLGSTERLKVNKNGITVNGSSTLTGSVVVGTSTAHPTLWAHGPIIASDDQALEFHGNGGDYVNSQGLTFKKSVSEMAVSQGRICAHWDPGMACQVMTFMIADAAGALQDDIFYNGGAFADRWLSVSGITLQCGNLVETSSAADKTDVRDVQAAEVDTAWKTLKPKKFRRLAPQREGRKAGPLRYGFVMEDMADDLTVKRPYSPKQGNTSGYSLSQVLALTVAKLKEVEAELAALKAKVK